MDYQHPQSEWFRENGLEPPSVVSHGTEEDIKAQLKPLTLTNWRLEGNRLIADSEMGEVSHLIPTDRIMTGVGADGLPILERIHT